MPTFNRVPALPFAAVVLVLLLSLAPASGSRPSPLASGSLASGQDVSRLFSEEIQQAAAKLKWRGERLSDETVYAIALTGLSWEPAWDKEALFWLGGGDWRKTTRTDKRKEEVRQAGIREVRQLYADHDFGRVVSTASTDFSLDEIGCDPYLKEAVGRSLLALGQPERAFPLLVAPFDPKRAYEDVGELNRRLRVAATDAARYAGLRKEVITFEISLLLEPGTDPPTLPRDLLRSLEDAGVDSEELALGILQAPRGLRGLSAYEYAAADLLAYRASQRLLPYLTHLVSSDDAYLRGRALIGLAVIAYRGVPGDGGWVQNLLQRTPREVSVSAGQQRLLGQAVLDAANSDRYRLRMAAALALGLLGSKDGIPVLQKLAKDRAYVLSPAGNGRESAGPRRIQFPVRMAAALALSRFGISVPTSNGEFSGKALDQARKNGQDVTNDRNGLRRDVVSKLDFLPLDPLFFTLPVPARR